jgi:DNA-binding transcriptional LysR family regulator
MVLAMSPGHALAQREEIWPDDLRGEIILDSPSDWRRPLGQASLTDSLGRAVRIVRTIDETVECIASGLGVIVMPRSIVTAHIPPTVIARPLRGVPRAELVAVWRPEDEGLPRVRSLIECVVRASRDALAGAGDGRPGRPASLI